MPEILYCRRCGTKLPADRPAGVCPTCVLNLAMETEVAPSPESSAVPPAPTAASAVVPGSRFAPLTPDELATHFPQLEVLELLGQGGMGVVYKARHRGLDRLVAVKILPPEISRTPGFPERFTREARALAKLSHPNIVAVFDFGQSRGLYYFVMEYVDGSDLRRMIRAGTIQPREALAIVPQICDALQFAHDEGIIHRDIKPENILIDKKGRVKIADFGLAKLLGVEQADSTLTAANHVMGTPRYMAPEQVENPQSVDHRADIYSLGVVFYEMLTGELPMGLFSSPSQKSKVDVRLDEVVLRSLEKEPQRRYQHASDVKTAVQAAVTSEPPTPVIPLPYAPVPSGPRLSRAALWGTLWLALMALIPLLIITLIKSRQSSLGVIFLAPLALGAVLAISGTTSLGFIGMRNIRQSEGQLHGFALAFFNAILFPVLLIDAIIVGLLVALWDPGDTHGKQLCAAICVVICLLVDVFAIRWAWRKATGAAPGPPWSRRRWAFVISSIAIAILVTLSMISVPARNSRFLPTSIISPSANRNATAALWNAVRDADLNKVDSAIANGAAINDISDDGTTPLMLAAWKGYTGAVDHLLARGASAQMRTKLGETPLMLAVGGQHADTVQKMLSWVGGDQTSDLNARSAEGATPLMIAASRGMEGTVKLLIDRGAEANAAGTVDGRTALMIAAERGHAPVVRVLLNAGADADVRDRNGITALMWAEGNGHTSIIELLHKSGATQDVRNWILSGFMLALNGEHQAAIEHLELARTSARSLQGPLALPIRGSMYTFPSPRASLLCILGECYQKNAKTDAAKKALDEAIAALPALDPGLDFVLYRRKTADDAKATTVTYLIAREALAAYARDPAQPPTLTTSTEENMNTPGMRSRKTSSDVERGFIH